jgi:transposase-like protein
MTKLVAIMKATRRKFSAGFKAKVAIEALKERESLAELSKRFEIHHTPKHGSWLDITEIELSALGNQCLSKRRISSVENLNEELLSWNTERNALLGRVLIGTSRLPTPVQS